MSVYPTEAGIDDRSSREARPVGAVEQPPPKHFSRLGIRDANKGKFDVPPPLGTEPPLAAAKSEELAIDRGFAPSGPTAVEVTPDKLTPAPRGTADESKGSFRRYLAVWVRLGERPLTTHCSQGKSTTGCPLWKAAMLV